MQQDLLTADDALYAELFDVAGEAAAIGNAVDEDVNPGINHLRNRGPVLKGTLRELLGLPGTSHGYTVPREGYTLLSFPACDRGFRENLLFSSHVYRENHGVMAMGNVILRQVGDEHRAFRAAVQPMFLKSRAQGWWQQNWIAEIVDTLLGELRDNSKAELNLQLCARIPMHTVTRGIGLEADEALDFRRHLLRGIGAIKVSPQEQGQSMQKVADMLLALVARRRGEPGDDVVTGLINAELALPGEEPRKLTDEEIIGYARLIILAGGGTTWRQMGITIWALMTHYHFWEACRDDRSLLDQAIEEAVRWNPTDPVFQRLVTHDVEVEGVTIPEGTRVDICLGAANRDPNRWERPDEYDIYRPRKYHLGFALGPHQCLGMNVAKQEMILALNGLMDLFPNMRLDPDQPPPRLVGGLEQRGMSALHVLLK